MAARGSSRHRLVALACSIVACTSDAAGPGPVSASQSSIVAASDTIGQCLTSCEEVHNEATTITVTLRDQFGNPISGAGVALAATPADSTLFTQPGPSGTSDANGVFTARFNSGRATVSVLSATSSGTPLAQTATVAAMPVLVAAGDIADCNRGGDDATAVLLDNIPGTVLPLGDEAYPNGRAEDFANCYHPTWGRHKARTRPVPGNHEYDRSDSAQFYFDYFGALAGPRTPVDRQGYYSYDVGPWHVVALNSEMPMNAGSPQVQWLRQDLAGRGDQCVLAYWHKPRYSSGTAGDTPGTQQLWQAVHDSGGDVVLVSHEHAYERFALLNAAGVIDSVAGMKQITIGTGGGDLINSFPEVTAKSELRDNTTRGVLKVTLYSRSYRWRFVPAPGYGAFTDSGTGSCR